MQVLPLPSKKYVDQINRLIRNFLWNDGKARIALKQLMLNYEDGGLKLTDITSLNIAIKISWIKRLCRSDGGFQKVFTNSICDMKECVWSLDETSLQKILKVTTNPFWHEVLDVWLKYMGAENVERNILTYPIWNSFLTNKNILSKKQEFIERGVVYINDLIKLDRGIMSYTEFKYTYNVKLNFLDYHSMIQSIPLEWRKSAAKTDKLDYVQNTVLDNILKCEKVCKYV